MTVTLHSGMFIIWPSSVSSLTLTPIQVLEGVESCLVLPQDLDLDPKLVSRLVAELTNCQSLSPLTLSVLLPGSGVLGQGGVGNGGAGQ